MNCQINYAIWWCSTHDIGLTEGGICPRGVRKALRATKPLRQALASKLKPKETNASSRHRVRRT